MIVVIVIIGVFISVVVFKGEEYIQESIEFNEEDYWEMLGIWTDWLTRNPIDCSLDFQGKIHAQILLSKPSVSGAKGVSPTCSCAVAIF